MTFKAFFILAIIAVIALGGVGYYLWRGPSTISGLDIKFDLPNDIGVGTPFELQVGVSNDSQNVLKDVRLMLELPEDIVFVGSLPDKNIDTKVLGNLGAGSLTEETFELLALGGESSIKEINATLSYNPENIGSRFEFAKSVDFSISGSNVVLDIAIPQKVFAGEDIETKIVYKNVSRKDIESLKLKLVYPPAFNFKSASLTPDFGNNVWELGGLRSNSEGKLSIKGQLIGPADSAFEFRAIMEMELLGRSYTIAEKSANISIAASPLFLSIALNGDQDYIAHLGDKLSYTITFTNNTDVPFKDVIVRARVFGDMVDLKTLSTDAYLRPSDNSLIWNTSNYGLLELLPAGSAGSVRFGLELPVSYPMKKLNDKNFTVKVEAEVESPTVPYFVEAAKTLSLAKFETKVGGKFNVDAKAFFRDAQAGVLNSGPWPLKAGQPTNFTIHWVITNFSDDIKNVEVASFLGGNVKLVNIVSSSIDTKPVYNDRSQEIVWQIPSISAGKGILTSPVEAVFQIEATPSTNDIGAPMTLVQETSTKATDDFTGETLTDSDILIRTTNLDDPTVNSSQGLVTQ